MQGFECGVPSVFEEIDKRAGQRGTGVSRVWTGRIESGRGLPLRNPLARPRVVQFSEFDILLIRALCLTASIRLARYESTPDCLHLLLDSVRVFAGGARGD